MSAESGFDAARRFIAVSNSTESLFDYSQVHLMKAPEQLRSHIPICAFFVQLLGEMSIVPCPAFYNAIQHRANEDGVRPLFPGEMVVAAKKMDAFRKYNTVKETWRPHFPWFIQISSKDLSNCLFLIFPSYRDGLIFVLQVFELGLYHWEGRTIKLELINEHVVPGYPSYMIFDCELYKRHYPWIKDNEGLKDLVKQLPAIVLKKAVEYGAVDYADVICVLYKDKSRYVQVADKRPDAAEGATIKDFKVSYHFIFSLYGFQKLPTSMILSEYMGWLGNVTRFLKDHDTLDCLANPICSSLPLALLSVDLKALPGGCNGFFTAYSRKPPGDWPAFKEEGVAYCMGVPVLVGSPNIVFPPPPHSPHSTELSYQQKLYILYMGCYTIHKDTAHYYRQLPSPPVSLTFT